MQRPSEAHLGPTLGGQNIPIQLFPTPRDATSAAPSTRTRPGPPPPGCRPTAGAAQPAASRGFPRGKRGKPVPGGSAS
jgi:hypothetical protein